MNDNTSPIDQLDALDEPGRALVPFVLTKFENIKLNTERGYLIKDLIPSTGLTVIWGPPKCGKSFWTFDVFMHVALGWPYHGRKAQQVPVVYLALEGGARFANRVEAFKQHHDVASAAFYLITGRIEFMIREAERLVWSIRQQLGENNAGPAVVMDTVNRGLVGSENNSEDMSVFISAAQLVSVETKCAVALVHHCGVEGTRPRGHTSLTAAVDAQIAIERGLSLNEVVARVEFAKDFAEGGEARSRLESVELGVDVEGDPISSMVVLPLADRIAVSPNDQPRLSKNQRTLFSILHDAGAAGLSTEDWNQIAREAGLGTRRKADLVDFRSALKAKKLVREYAGKWTVAHNS
jgi:AAA domain